VNSSPDVLIVQRVLNRIDPSQGGAAPKLSSDGIVGVKTIGAIKHFQSRQTGIVDGRVDPNKRTIAAFNRLIAGTSIPLSPGVKLQSSGAIVQPGQNNPTNVFFSVTPEHMRRVYLEHVPVAHSCVFTALIMAQNERRNIERGLASNSPARLLLNKHFKLDQNPLAATDIGLIIDILAKIRTLLAANAAIATQTFAAAPGRFSYNRVAHSGVMALAIANGIADKGGTYNLTAEDGTRFKVGMDKVLILPRYNFTVTDYQVATLVHELAHFVGPPDGHPNVIDDPPSRSSAESEIQRMSARSRPRLAECYATFAFEARFGRPPVHLSLDLNVPF
jgi:peptidoglycan hydrolase-like protein with peptidoglycan-binding domain